MGQHSKIIEVIFTITICCILAFIVGWGYIELGWQSTSEVNVVLDFLKVTFGFMLRGLYIRQSK